MLLTFGQPVITNTIEHTTVHRKTLENRIIQSKVLIIPRVKKKKKNLVYTAILLGEIWLTVWNYPKVSGSKVPRLSAA